MSLPDVLGFRLEEALPVLTGAGWRAQVVTTYPPRRENISAAGPRRVLRAIKTGAHTVELVVAYEGAGEGCPGDRPGADPDL